MAAAKVTNPLTLHVVAVAALGLVCLPAVAQAPVPAVVTHAQSSSVRCEAGKPGCPIQYVPFEQWCRQSPEPCAAYKARESQRVSNFVDPAARDRARFESRLNDRIQSACIGKDASDDRCDKLRLLLEKLKAEDQKAAGSHGG